MQIKKVEPFHVLWQAGKSAWVRLTADNGLYGIGEASPMADGNASLEMIHSAFTPYLIGQNPLDHRLIQDHLMHAHIKLGPDGAFAAALAAVDIALWDLKGKILGLPVYQLLGGAWRKELPFYASIGGNAGRSPQEVCRVVEEWLEIKPALIKIRLDGDKTRRDADIRGDIARAEAVRRLVGDQFPLAFDANNAYSIQGAIRVGQALQELGFEWFEEPVQHYHMHSFDQVSRALEIAIAAGEQEYTLQGIQRLIEAGVRIVQPDIVKTGGFTGLMDMAALARLYGVDFVPHQTQPSIGHRASMHLAASLTHAHYPVEFSDKSGRQEIVFRNPDLKPHNGKFILPDLPGLGLELDERELEERIRIWK